jgi:brefeldin A-inhibited guanine nucleotide-exchange protein
MANNAQLSNRANEAAAATVVTSVPTFSLRYVITKCTVQHLLLDSVADLFRLHFTRLSNQHIETLLQPLSLSIEFAHIFNSDIELRRRLWTAGFREYQRAIPDLFFQEAHAAAVYLSILLRMFADGSHPQFDASAVAEPLLLPLYSSSIADFVEKDRINRSVDGQRPHEDELRCKDPVLVLLLQGLKEWTDEQFKRHLRSMFPLLMDLIECESITVRKALRELLHSRLPHIFSC